MTSGETTATLNLVQLQALRALAERGAAAACLRWWGSGSSYA